MTPFELAEPTTVEDALRLLDPDDSTVRPLGGGTALMLMMKPGVFRPTRLVFLRNIPWLSLVVTTPDGALSIDSLTPLSHLHLSTLYTRPSPIFYPSRSPLSH